MLNRCFVSDGFFCPIELPGDNLIATLPLRQAQCMGKLRHCCFIELLEMNTSIRSVHAVRRNRRCYEKLKLV